MGKRVEVTLFDDLDPTLDATEERSFAIDGAEYHLDLSEKNAKRFDSEIDVWVQAGTRVGREKRPQKRSGAKNTFSGGEPGLPLAEIRAWAQANGFEVSDRGRVSAEIVRAWKARDEKPETPAKKAAPAKKTAETDPNFSDKN